MEERLSEHGPEGALALAALASKQRTIEAQKMEERTPRDCGPIRNTSSSRTIEVGGLEKQGMRKKKIDVDGRAREGDE